MSEKEKIVITSWNVISPIGIGAADFSRNLKEKKSGLKKLNNTEKLKNPDDYAYSIPEFEIPKFIKNKKIRQLDRISGMSIITAKHIIDNLTNKDKLNNKRIGFVLGSTNGSVESIYGYIKDTFLEKPYMVDPGLFVKSVMNYAAGQTAIWYKLQGLNATLSAGHLTGMNVIDYASVNLRNKNADLIIAGSAEDYCLRKAWAFYLKRNKRPSPKLGEGCALFALENESNAIKKRKKIYARIESHKIVSRLCFRNNEDLSMELAACIEDVMKKEDVSPDQIWAISKHQCGGQSVNDIENKAIENVMGKITPEHQITVSNFIGNTYSASASFQLAGLLALNGDYNGSKNRYGLITTLSSDNSYGCMLIKAGNENENSNNRYRND